MMRKYMLVVAVGLLVWPLCAQTKTIQVATPGTLSALLGTDTLVTSLAVEGNINAADLVALRELPKLTELSLAGTEIAATSADKALWLGKKNFDANVLPLYIFSSSNLTSVTLPDNIIGIGEGAFSASTALKEVVIGDSVTAIGDYAFYGCTSLEKTSLPASLIQIGKGAFSGCASLSEMKLFGTGLTSIPDEAFKGTTALKFITFPAGLKSIGAEAFYGSGLETLTLEANVESAGDYAFSSMPYLKEASMNNVSSGNGLLFADSALEKISDLERVGSYGLAECTSLDLSYALLANDGPLTASENANRPFMENLKSLGNYALAGNQSPYLLLSNGFDSVGTHVFDGMDKLGSINVYSLGRSIPATNVDPFEGIEPDSIELYVDATYLDEWMSDAEWSKFSIKSTTVGVDTPEVDSNAINGWIDAAGLLHIQASETLTSVIVTDTGGMLIATVSPKSSDCVIDLSAIDSPIVIVKASTSGATRIYKLQKS